MQPLPPNARRHQVAWYNHTQIHLVNRKSGHASLEIVYSLCILMGIEFRLILKPLDQLLTNQH